MTDHADPRPLPPAATDAAPTVLIVPDGGPPTDAPTLAAPPRAVIAVDGGLRHTAALGHAVTHVVGDLDSVDPEALARARRDGVAVHAAPSDKDVTDLELALTLAVSLRAGRIVVLGGGGGRLDHATANLAVLADPSWASAHVEARLDGARLWIVRDTLELSGPVGATLSLLAMGGPAHGVRTRGLRWPLAGEELSPSRARGVSNELSGPEVSIELTGGVLAVIDPDARCDARTPRPEEDRP